MREFGIQELNDFDRLLQGLFNNKVGEVKWNNISFDELQESLGKLVDTEVGAEVSNRFSQLGQVGALKLLSGIISFTLNDKQRSHLANRHDVGALRQMLILASKGVKIPQAQSNRYTITTLLPKDFYLFSMKRVLSLYPVDFTGNMNLSLESYFTYDSNSDVLTPSISLVNVQVLSLMRSVTGSFTNNSLFEIYNTSVSNSTSDSTILNIYLGSKES